MVRLPIGVSFVTSSLTNGGFSMRRSGPTGRSCTTRARGRLVSDTTSAAAGSSAFTSVPGGVRAVWTELRADRLEIDSPR